MGFLDKAKQAAEQAANRANEAVEDVQTKRELTTTFKLAGSGAISHPELETHVARIRELQAKLEDGGATTATGNGDAPSPTESVEQPMSGGGPGAA